MQSVVSPVSPINQLTAWVTLAALLTGCATPGTRTAPGQTAEDSIPAIIAAMEKEDAEGRSTASRDMVELPEAMREKIAAFLAPPAGPGIENLELRYARPYAFDAQAAGEFGYTPLPSFRRESRRGLRLRWSGHAAGIILGILGTAAAVTSLVFYMDAPNRHPAENHPKVVDERRKAAVGLLVGSALADIAVLTLIKTDRPTVPVKRNIKRNQAAFGEWAADNQLEAPQRQAVLDKWEAGGPAVDTIRENLESVLNRRRGYIEAVNPDTGTVTIIWPDLIPPESQQ